MKTRQWRHIYHDIGIPRPKSHDIKIPRAKNCQIEIRELKHHHVKKQGHDSKAFFSEDKKPQHWDSKTEKPWHRDSKKPWHWVSAEFWPLFLLIVGGRQMPKNNGSVGITDYIYYSEQITQKWGSEDVCPNENSWYCEHSVKNQRGKDRRPNFAIFVVWSALIVGS